MPESNQIECPICKHMERPNWCCDICDGLGEYTPKMQILKDELECLLNWLEFNNSGITNKEKVDGYLKSTERFY